MPFKTETYTLAVNETDSVSAELCRPPSIRAVYVLSHGAGTNMHHAFMKELSVELANHQIATLRYNFLYSEQKKKRPDFPAVAHQAVAAAIAKAHELFAKVPLVAGGKSFGGRMTSQYLSENAPDFVKGIVLVGFPLHPAGKPSIDRSTHLDKIKIPMLFLQGTRDALAEWHLIEQVTKKLPTSTLAKFEGADHSFKVARQNLIPALATKINLWIEKLIK